MGTLALSNEWQLFPEPVINAEVFRFTYEVDWNAWANLAGYRSFAVARFYYPLSEGSLVSSAFRLWPKPEREVRTYKITDEFFEKNYLIRDVGAKRITKWKPLPNSTTIIPWNLKAEYLL